MRHFEECSDLERGIEGLLRVEMTAQYDGWPWESTTDGSIIGWCRRTNDTSLDVAGLIWIDFGGDQFPFRADLRRTADGSVAVVGYLGEVDPRTGAPPRLPGGTVMLPGPSGPELIVGRRQTPITWTRAFSIPPP